MNQSNRKIKHIAVEPDTHAKLKVVGALEGKSMGAYIADVVNNYKVPTAFQA